MTIECFRQLAQSLQQGAAVLATVTQVRGSVPREVGAKMIICASGEFLNTIGGGAGEAKVIQQAKTVLETGNPQAVEIDLSGSPQRAAEGICGGTMQVWLARWSGAEAIALVQTILTQLEAGQSVTLVTPLVCGRSPYCLAAAEPPPLVTSGDAWIEQLLPPPTLLIVGAGHIGIQLAKVADLIGFQVAVQDDRPDWANGDRYPQARRILTESIERAIAEFAQHEHFYAALVTRGYQYDLAALKALLNRDRPCHYIGMIGSQKRVQQVYQAIAKTGISVPQLTAIYAPIGLEIGACTPEEIAVSIGAELILARRGGTGRSLSEPRRQSRIHERSVPQFPLE